MIWLVVGLLFFGADIRYKYHHREPVSQEEPAPVPLSEHDTAGDPKC